MAIHQRILIHLLIIIIAVSAITLSFLAADYVFAIIPSGGRITSVVANTSCPTTLSPIPGNFAYTMSYMGPQVIFNPAGFPLSMPGLCYIGFLVPSTCGVQPAGPTPPMFGVTPC